MNIVDIRNNLADALNRVAYANERIVLERRGKGVAALVSMQDLALLEELGDSRTARPPPKRVKSQAKVKKDVRKK